MKAITPIDKFVEGAGVQGFYLCVEKHLRHTRNGDLYLDLVLRDRTGSINAKLWDKVEDFIGKFKMSDPVAVSGTVESFQDRLQLVVKKINLATIQHYARYGYDPALIVPASEHDPQDLWRDTVKLIKSLKNEYLQKIVSVIFKENKERLLVLPASVSIHHNYRSGFLEHTLSMAEIGIFLAGHYQVDRDLLLAGILLHDIGKVHELEGEFEQAYSDEGNFLGHIVIGLEMVAKVIAELKDFPEDLSLKLKHLLAAHQGQPDWGSPRRPVFPEALLLHMIDNMDAKFNLMQKIIADSPEEGNWTDLRNYFRVPLYKGDNASDKTG